MMHPGTLPLYFGLLALGGLRWNKTSPCVASLLLIPRMAAHLEEGLLRWERVAPGGAVLSRGSSAAPAAPRCPSDLQQQPLCPWLRDRPGRDIAQFSWKERWDDGSKPTCAEILLLPHLPRTFTTGCPGRVGTKGQQKNPWGSIHRMPAGFSLAITTSLPPNTRDKGELFTLQHWLSHQPWDLQRLSWRPAC